MGKIYCIFILLSVLIALAYSKRHHESRIHGGYNVTIENYKYAVSLMFNGKHICGGTIIAPSFVITTAHCTISKDPKSLSIRAGSTFKATGGVVRRVQRIIQHPNFTPQKGLFDVSILKLSKPLQYNKSIGFVDLPYSGEEVYGYVYGSIAGWGDLDDHGTRADRLNAANIATLDQVQCQKFYPEVTYLHFCAGSTLFGPHGPCMGDSGAPFVVNGKLVGIVTYSYKCTQEQVPTVFTKISAVRTFISAQAGV